MHDARSQSEVLGLAMELIPESLDVVAGVEDDDDVFAEAALDGCEEGGAGLLLGFGGGVGCAKEVEGVVLSCCRCRWGGR